MHAPATKKAQLSQVLRWAFPFPVPDRRGYTCRAGLLPRWLGLSPPLPGMTRRERPGNLGRSDRRLDWIVILGLFRELLSGAWENLDPSLLAIAAPSRNGKTSRRLSKGPRLIALGPARRARFSPWPLCSEAVVVTVKRSLVAKLFLEQTFLARTASQPIPQ